MISKDLNKCDRSLIHTKFKFSNPHSSAFLDIDGDCINDILIRSMVEEEVVGTNSTRTKYFLEIWRGIIEDQKIKYCLSQSSVYNLEHNLGPFSIADINRDSMPDIIFPILESYPPKIIIGYNQINLEYDWTADYCETHNKFIIKNSDNTYSYVNMTDLTIPLVFDELREDNKNSNLVKTITLTHLATQTFYHTEHFPALLRFGDINMDSYPDFTVILYDKSDFSQNSYVFLNLDESSKHSPISNRSFSYSHTYFNPYINNAVYSSFFDLDEDGKLDIIVVYQEANKIINTAGFYNTYVYDNYYLKSFVLNQKNTLFQYEIGVNFRFITTNLDGSRRMDLSSQATQVSSPLSLHLPYSYVGIGRSNNYIENFHVISGKYLKVKINKIKFFIHKQKLFYLA
jgi:integrin alpha FG-GAP repeat containing protein 1